jgi:hypothetical protein
MAICTNCPDNCIEPRTTLCLAYEGNDIGDIKCGDSINSVLSKLATNTTTIAAASVTSTTVQTYTSTVMSSCAKTVVNPKVTYEVKSTTAGYTLEWNTKVDQNILSRKIITSVGTFTSEVGSAVIPANKFPFSLEFQFRFSSSCGDILLSKRVNVLKIGKYSVVLDVSDLNNSSVEMTTDEALQNSYDQIALVQQQLDNVISSDFDSTLLGMDTRLTELEGVDPLAEVKYTDQNVDITSSVSEALTAIFALTRIIEVQVNLNKAEITVIKTQLSNIPSIVIE